MMIKNDICIVIPIYKDFLNEFEVQSIKQCLTILQDYSIYFAAPKSLKTEYYKNAFPLITKFIFFEDRYFLNIEGYNRLMLGSHFYKKFRQYQYMLIYQTDSFVFKDDLLDWSKKGYDYIGGLWFEGYHGDPNKGAKLWQAGNGGFSLRKIQTMITVLDSNKRLKSRKELLNAKHIEGKFKIFKNLLFLIKVLLKSLGYKNNVRFYARNFNKNEDVFFMNLFLNYSLISIPTAKDALFFSWDKYPDFLYRQLQKLPFGCHGWYRNEEPYLGNKDFWQIKIQDLQNKV